MLSIGISSIFLYLFHRTFSKIYQIKKGGCEKLFSHPPFLTLRNENNHSCEKQKTDKCECRQRG